MLKSVARVVSLALAAIFATALGAPSGAQSGTQPGDLSGAAEAGDPTADVTGTGEHDSSASSSDEGAAGDSVSGAANATPGASPAAQAGPADPRDALTPRELVYALQAEVERLQRQVLEFRQEARELRQEVENLQTQNDQMQKLVASLSDSFRPVDDVLGAMETDPTVRKSIGEATQGRINIENYTGREVPLFVNGTRWNVRTNDSYIYAPVGKVTFQQVGDEQPTFRDVDDWELRDGVLQLTYRLYAR